MKILSTTVISLILIVTIIGMKEAGASESKKSKKESDVSSEQVAKTVSFANKFDYFSDSVTGLTKKSYSRSEIVKLMEDYGEFVGPLGMPVEEYKAAMNAEWVDCTNYKKWTKTPATVNLDINKSYTYDQLVKVMKKLSGREGVYLFDIGSTTQGRRMYALEIDIPSDKEKKMVILTGNIHARETAGSIYLLKEIAELLQSDSSSAIEILKNTKFAIVPCVNPDGREGVAFDTKNYKYSNGNLWKAASNGTDLNRNFPGLVWSQVKKGNTRTDSITDNPKKIFYPGEYAGSCNETKAMMKFLYHYIKIEKAQVLLDYHQQGRIAYAGKPWQTNAQQKRCKDLSKFLFAKMNSGNSHNYIWYSEEDDYGLNGTGSTLTDFAVSIASGAKYSPGYGFYVYTDGKKEYPLIMIPRLEQTSLSVVSETNKKFATSTIEIGYGKEYLGYSSSARSLLSKEYSKYRFDRLLSYLYDYLKQK